MDRQLGKQIQYAAIGGVEKQLMSRNLLAFVRGFFEHRHNFDGGYIQPPAVRLYPHHGALFIAFMRDGVRGQNLRHEIVPLFDHISGPLVQSAEFAVFLGVQRRQINGKKNQGQQINRTFHDTPLPFRATGHGKAMIRVSGPPGLYENPPIPPLSKGGKGGFSCFVVSMLGMGVIPIWRRGDRDPAAVC